MDNFWTSWYFNFAVQPKYYISRHFNVALWLKYYNLRHFSFPVVLKIEFFMSVSFQHFRNFGKSGSLNARLNTFLSYVTHHCFTRITPENLLSGWDISSFSSTEFQESSKKATHKKCIFIVLLFHRWVFKRFLIGIMVFLQNNSDKVIRSEIGSACGNLLLYKRSISEGIFLALFKKMLCFLPAITSFLFNSKLL